MKLILAIAAVMAAGPACPSFAETQVPASKIVGNGQKPAPEEMVIRGYAPVKENYWWNATERQCVYIAPTADPVSQIVRPSVCGMAVRKPVAAASCPVRLSPDLQARFTGCPQLMAGR